MEFVVTEKIGHDSKKTQVHFSQIKCIYSLAHYKWRPDLMNTLKSRLELENVSRQIFCFLFFSLIYMLYTLFCTDNVMESPA